MELRKDQKAERLEYLGSHMDFWQNWKDVGWWLASRQTSSPRLEDNNIIYKYIQKISLSHTLRLKGNFFE